MECHSNLFGPFRLVDSYNMMRAYEDILEVINGRTEKKGYETTIDIYEAARIALIESECMRKHFDPVIKNTNTNKQNVHTNMGVYLQISKW